MREELVIAVKTDSFEMDCIRFGHGDKNLVIISGANLLPLSISAVAIKNQYELFAKDYTVYLFDRKKDMEEGYSVSDMADDTAEAMRKLGITEAYVYGVSLGGMISQVIAARYPQMVRKLVLASTACSNDETAFMVFDRWIKLCKDPKSYDVYKDIFEKIYSPDYCERYRRALKKIGESLSAAHFGRFGIMAKACRDNDCTDEVSAISCPVLVINGAKDEIFTPSAVKIMADHISECTRIIYNEGYHSVYDEIPLIKDQIWDFLSHEKMHKQQALDYILQELP